MLDTQKYRQQRDKNTASETTRNIVIQKDKETYRIIVRQKDRQSQVQTERKKTDQE